MIFFELAIIFGLVFAYALLAPKPEFQDAKPAEEDDFKFPTAEEGKPISVLFGTRRVENPNIVWWGDLNSVAIKEEVETGGLF